MNARDALLAAALAAPESTGEAIPVLGINATDCNELSPSDPSDPALSSGADPECAEALVRSKALEFSVDELSALRGLSMQAMQRVLSNGADRDKIAAAKLVVAMSRVERETYLELRKQSRPAGHANEPAGIVSPEFLAAAMVAASRLRAPLIRATDAEVLAQ